MYQDPIPDAPTTARPTTGGALSGDLPTIGTPTIGAPGPYVAPGPIHPGTYPTDPTGGYPPSGPPPSRGRGPILLVVGASLAALIAVGALVVVLMTGGKGDDTAATDGAGIDMSTSTAAPTSSTAPTTTAAPPQTVATSPAAAGPATNLPTPTNPPLQQAPSGGSGPSGATGSGAPMLGSYVAVLWSDVLSNVTGSDIDGYQSQRAGQYGVPTSVVFGDDYLSLRDGTVAVVYAGGFRSSREAAQWCRNQGVTDVDACFGVVLDNTHDWQNKGNNERTYISQL